jgi:hypothetical protein
MSFALEGVCPGRHGSVQHQAILHLGRWPLHRAEKLLQDTSQASGYRCPEGSYEIQMSQIFLSYAREDSSKVAHLGLALARLGWSVWRDDRIRASAEFDDQIERELDLALCVVVVWSRASIASVWVRSEAGAADDQGKLVPVSFETDVLPPLRFRQLNAAILDSPSVADPNPSEGALRLLREIAYRTNQLPRGMDPNLFIHPSAASRSGARRVTAGQWRLTTRFLFVGAWYQLMLYPDGTVSGKGGWTISRATLSGRWTYDRHRQVLQLEMSGGISGMESMVVQVDAWEDNYTAVCTFRGRKARLQRLTS